MPEILGYGKFEGQFLEKHSIPESILFSINLFFLAQIWPWSDLRL
jgi:hypothetical protein